MNQNAKIEDALRKAVWALHNIQDHLEGIDLSKQNPVPRHQISIALANANIVVEDIEYALAYMRLTRLQKIAMKLTKLLRK